MENRISAMNDATAIFNYFVLTIAYDGSLKKGYYQEKMSLSFATLSLRDPAATEQDYLDCFRYYIATIDNFKQALKESRQAYLRAGYLLPAVKSQFRPVKLYPQFCSFLNKMIALMIAKEPDKFLKTIQKEI